MHDEREWWRPYVAAVEVVRASGAERTQNSYCSAHQAEVGEWTAPRDPMPEGVGAAAVRIPITPGWDLRPGADLPHFDRLIRLTPKNAAWLGQQNKSGRRGCVCGSERLHASSLYSRGCDCRSVWSRLVLWLDIGFFSQLLVRKRFQGQLPHRLKNGMLRSPAVLGATRQLCALTSQDASISPADSLKASLRCPAAPHRVSECAASENLNRAKRGAKRLEIRAAT